MKKMKKYGIAMMAFLISINLCSCANDANEPVGPNEKKEIEIKLGFSGEISVNDSPLGRADATDLYAVQVYSKKNSDDATEYVPFAYGLFDDITDLRMTVTEGFKYKFVATMVVDGKNKIKVTDNKYGEPFGNQAITSVFTKSSTAGFTGLGNGSAMLTGAAETTSMPTLDRYYGEKEVTPTATNKDVEIYMLRTVFGLKFIGESLDQADESIKITITGNPETLVLTSGKTSTETCIYTFSNVAEAYAGGNTYTNDINLKIEMQNVAAIEKSITVTRNMLSTITIHEPNHSGVITIQKEETEMSAGTNYEIDANGNVTSSEN